MPVVLLCNTATATVVAGLPLCCCDVQHRSAAKLALQDYQGALADAQAAVAIDET